MKRLENIQKEFQILNLIWGGIKYPSGKDDWGKFEKKMTLTLLLMCCMKKKWKYVQLVYQNITQYMKKKIKFLMVPNEKGWHYPAISKLPALLRGITSKSNGGFYCVHCLHYFRTENKL